MLFTNAPEATWFVKHWPLAHEKGRQTGHDGYHWVSIFTTITASQRQMKKDVLCSCAMTSWRNGWHEMCRSCCGSKQKLESHPGLDNFVPKLRSVQPASFSASWMRFSQGCVRYQFCPFARLLYFVRLTFTMVFFDCEKKCCWEHHWGILSQNHGLTFINTEAEG